MRQTAALGQPSGRDSARTRASWLRRAKEEWGVSDNVSFDKGCEEALTAVPG